MYIVFIRTALLYFLVILAIRLMGKRQIGQLQPYELVITIMISDLATLPMQDVRLPLLLGIIPIVTLLFTKTILTKIQQKSILIRKFVDGSPCVIISHGKINLKVTKNQGLTIDDILEEIRIAGYLDIKEIQYAILENNGQLSVIPKSKYDTVKKEDLNIKTQDSTIPLILYIDGKVNTKAFEKIHKDIDWLDKELKFLKAPKKENLFLVMLDSKGQVFYQVNNEQNSQDEFAR